MGLCVLACVSGLLRCHLRLAGWRRHCNLNCGRGLLLAAAGTPWTLWLAAPRGALLVTSSLVHSSDADRRTKTRSDSQHVRLNVRGLACCFFSQKGGEGPSKQKKEKETTESGSRRSQPARLKINTQPASSSSQRPQAGRHSGRPAAAGGPARNQPAAAAPGAAGGRQPASQPAARATARTSIRTSIRTSKQRQLQPLTHPPADDTSRGC
eukprot:COSAG01_NODE_3364_length_6193_cov_5.789465_6_plen_210_part_00